jgi:hypothetical protein
MNRVMKGLATKKAGKKRIFASQRLPKAVESSLGTIYSSADFVVNAPFKNAQKGGSTASYGIMPLAEQLVRNTYSTGIKTACLRREDRKLYLDIEEGEGIKRLPLSPKRTVYTVLKFGTTEYRACIWSQFTKNEDNIDVLVVRITFPEVSSTRYIKVFFHDDKLDFIMSESPGLGLVWMFAD